MTATRNHLDGRVARGRRNREAVVEAYLSLLEDGDPRPTARAIAERAGVSLRSVFQHFSDLEQLYAVAGRRELAKLTRMARPIDPGLPLPARIDAFVAQRVAVLEALSPVARAARVREPFSPQLQANRDELLRVARRECERVFAPEIRLRPGAERADLVTALALAATWSSWHCLREEMHLTTAQAAGVLRYTLTSLLRPPFPGGGP